MKKIHVITAFLLLWMSNSFAANTQYQLHVHGLVCPFCEYSIEKSVSKLKGVENVKANLKEGIVTVLIADGVRLPEDKIQQAITDAGFTLDSIEQHEHDGEK